MPACKVGCCPDEICKCSLDCECLLPFETNFHGRLGFQNPSLFADDDYKKQRMNSTSTICPCKDTDDLPDLSHRLQHQLSCVERKFDESRSENDSKIGRALAERGTDSGDHRKSGSGAKIANGGASDLFNGSCCNDKKCEEKCSEIRDVAKNQASYDEKEDRDDGISNNPCCKEGSCHRKNGGDGRSGADNLNSSCCQDGKYKEKCSSQVDADKKSESCCEKSDSRVGCVGLRSSCLKDGKRKAKCSRKVDSDKKQGLCREKKSGGRQCGVNVLKTSCCKSEECGDECSAKDSNYIEKRSDGGDNAKNLNSSCCKHKKCGDKCSSKVNVDKKQGPRQKKIIEDERSNDNSLNSSSCCKNKRCGVDSSDIVVVTEKRVNDQKLKSSTPCCKDEKCGKASSPETDAAREGSSCRDRGCCESKHCDKKSDDADSSSKTVLSQEEIPSDVAGSKTLGGKKEMYGREPRRKSCPQLYGDGKPRVMRRMLSERRPSCFQHSSSSLGGLRDPDPHHGHDHHHVHEYHHHGGHHHHANHHHDDHCHDHHDNTQHDHNDDNHHHGDHGHTHADSPAPGDGLPPTCSSLSCCESACDRKSCCEDPTCKAREVSSSSEEDLTPLLKSVQVDVEVGDLPIQTTKLRVQNLCCPKESHIVNEELRKLEGITNVRVNVLGRVVHVSHHPSVVSPTELMVTLNKRHLGASIVDTGAEEAVEHGLSKSLKILLATLALQTVLFGVAMAAMFSHTSWYMWVAIVEICFGVLPVLQKAVYAVRNREIDLNILITITVAGTLAIQEWIEGAAVVYVFTAANFLQQYCFHRVHKTISSLMLSKPSKAVMACTGECIPIEKVPIGTIIAVRQGELIPLDGIVVKGSASVDESSISGEAAPVEKTLDSLTYSGTVIQHGYLEIETTSSASSSTISKISAMMEDAQMNVSPTEVMVNRFANYYTPLVVLVATLVFLIPLFLGLAGVEAYDGQVKTWGERALIVLVTACPCALLMATPTVVICGINGAARLGALIKGGTYLEALSQISFLAFDKTGTLTEGKFQVVNLLPVEKADESKVLRWAAALESKSSHPLAAAVVTEFTGECIADFVADSEELLLPEVADFCTMEGQGIAGDVEGHHIEIGNYSLLDRLGISLSPKFEAAYISYCSDSKTVVFVCVDGELALMISLADIIRWESCSALTWLQDLGVHLAMLTGDSRETATAVQKELKIDSCISEMRPDDKLNWISEVQQREIHTRMSCLRRRRTHVVGMVGDGVNDGPALAAANVGIAMAAGGSALAVEAAGVALMTNNVLKVPEMICLSRLCRRIILQNIFLAVLLKLGFVAVALTGFGRVWMAVVADLVGLLAVILNGVRPLRWHPPGTRMKKATMPKPSWRKKRPVLMYESVV